MNFELSRHIAVVTGASKGIGLAITRSFLDQGVRVVAASRNSSPELDALSGENLLHVSADLMNPEAPAQLVQTAMEYFGRIDILVNNAGGPPPGVSLPRTSFLDAGDDWTAMFEFNLFAPVRAIRAALPPMIEQGSGTVINISSALARQPAPMSADYGAAKAAVNNLGKVLSEEFGPRGIRVNTVSPGAVRTAWWTDEGGAADIIAAQAGVSRDEVMDTLVPQMMNMSTGRLVDPQEVADVVTLLASPRSASINGAEFVVDGGFLKSL